MSNGPFDRLAVADLLEHQQARFKDEHPVSHDHVNGCEVLLGGVPMSWMNEWAGGYPIYFDSAQGATLIDVDATHLWTSVSVTRQQWPGKRHRGSNR